MIARRRWWYVAGLLLSLISLLASILADDTVSSLAFLPVLMIFLGLPLVAFIERSRTIPSWFVFPLATLLGLGVASAVLVIVLAITSGSDHVILVASGIATALNGLQIVLGPREDVVHSMKSIARKDAAAASAFIILLILVLYTVVQPFPVQQLTQFYLLNEEGKTTNMPYQVVVGEDIELTIGVANHEGRMVQYHVQVWLAEMGSLKDPNSTLSMYYMDAISFTLDHMPMPLSGQWVPQHEFDYNLTVPTTGPLRLHLFLFFDEVPSEFDDLVPGEEYYDEGLKLIEMARERRLLSLSIALNAKAAEG